MKYISILSAVLVLFSCNTAMKQPITSASDYGKFLKPMAVETSSKYFELWNSKIKPDSMQLTSFAIVGEEYNRYFQETGNIDFLKKSERALKKALEIAAIGKPDRQRALARNYISQHRFKEALSVAEASYNKGNGLRETHSLLFDIHMELGNYETAERYLDSIAHQIDFGYLIRKAKWQDHLGYLEDTIAYMEQAKYKTERMQNKNLMLWSYTNLADYYGHAGRLEDSYQHYLKALDIDPQNAYAKKGIAWIVFSYEKKPEEALRILDSVTQYYEAPDYYLFKAEIATYMGDDLAYTMHLDRYFNLTENVHYGDMYNTHHVDLFLEETEQFTKALQLAKREVSNRPTPESYGMLATAYLRLGEKKKALAIVEDHIMDKTYEPAVQYRAAEIYKANGLQHRVAGLKSELLDAAYELGPVLHHKITQL